MTGATVPLFNPRVQTWHDHMQWSADGTLVLGVTPCGRATVEALQMNNAYVVKARARPAHATPDQESSGSCHTALSSVPSG